MKTRRIHLINPVTDSFTTNPVYFKKALYSPLAGLLAVASLIPHDQYEVILTDENIQAIDFDIKADMVGISAMTSYVKRGYQIADAFRERGVKVIMGGVHPSFMPTEALQHADAVVVGEAELVMPEVLKDLKDGRLSGIYKAGRLHSMVDLPLPRYDLVKTKRYFNRAFIQTSRGCRHACTFCAEHLMNGLRLRLRPIDDVLREIESCGERIIALNDADFFGSPAHAAKLMKALKNRGFRWQAGVNSRDAFDDRLLELAAESGCYMISIGLESISRESLKNVHKHQNRPEKFKALVKKVQSYGIMVFGLFMFGFDHDNESVFEETSRFNIDAGFDACAYSLLTPYPGTLIWFEMLKQDRILSCDWNKYDQGHIVYRPKNLTAEQLMHGHASVYRSFYSIPSIFRRFPRKASRNRLHWILYNMIGHKRISRRCKPAETLPKVIERSLHRAKPPVMPERKDWEALVLETSPREHVITCSS